MIRVFNFFALLFGLLTSASVYSAEPADAAIKSAMDDVARFEQQLGSNPSKNTINRTLKLLTLTRQRLDSSPNQSDPSWIEADAQLRALTQRLEAPAGSPSTAPASAPAAAATPASAPAPQSQSSNSGTRQLISQDSARLKKLLRDIQSASSTLDQGGVMPFQDPAYVAKFQQTADKYRQQLAAYADFPDNPEVQACAQALQTFDNMIAFGISEGSKAGDALGDVQAQLADLYQRMHASRPPDVPNPINEDSLDAWIAQLAQIREQSAADIATLQEIKANAYLPNNVGTVEQGAAFDMQNVDSMIHNLNRNLQNIDGAVAQLASNFDAQLEHSEDTFAYFEELDPSDHHAQANAFLGEGQLEENLARIDAEIENIKAAIVFDERMDRDILDQHEDLLERAEDVREDYEDKREEALELVRMPEEASDDDDLLEIAEETLENPKYEVGDIERMVINADMTHHSKESSEVEFDDVDVSLSGKVTLSGTETTTFYEWDQFQVATAEEVGDKYYIFYNTFRLFTSGASTTPLNRWILSSRFQSVEILEENIDPDWF